MVKVLDDIKCIKYIWRLKSVTQIEDLCVYIIVKDKAVWRLATLTLPDF